MKKMASTSKAADTDASLKESEDGAMPGYKDVNAFSQQTLRSLMVATKSSNELPSTGDDYDYYSSFGAFREFMDLESNRILNIIQTMMRYHGAKGNLTTSSEATEIEEKFDVLVDANDQLLERVGTFLDEAAGLKKQEAPLVIASVTPKNPISGSWNKKSLPTYSEKKGSFRLLAARRVERPQLMFKDKVDNTSRPFVPKIKHKPNALKPLPESLMVALSENQARSTEEEGMNEDFSFPHPYQFELDHFTPAAEELEKSTAQMPGTLDETPVTMINSVDDLNKLCETLKAEKAFAVDLEHHSYRTFLGITCLMQISTRTQDYIIDAIGLRSELHILNEVFTDPKIVKVFHGSDLDIEWLQRDLGVYVVNMFDTGQAARVLNLAHYSLAHLLWTYCQVEADKQYQLADWRIRPLPQELISYAREDTHYLLYIYDCMKNQLVAKGNEQKNLLHAVLQRSKQICQKRYEKPRFTEYSHLELYRRGKKTFNSQQLSALKGLYGWRDATARRDDESTGYVLPNHMLLQIANVLPREAQGILACCNPIPPLVRQSLNELFDILKKAREVPLTKTVAASTEMRPTRQQHPKYNVDSLLQCPHDLSHQNLDMTTSNINTPDLTLIAKESTMFSDEKTLRVPPVQLKDEPRLSVFSWKSKADTPNLTNAQRKTAKIKASFVSPFEKYMPSSKPSKTKNVIPELSGELEHGKVTRIEPASIQWRLLPHTPREKPVEESKPVVISKIPQQAKIQFSEDLPAEEEDATPLRNKLPSKKKRKRVEESDKPAEAAPQKQQVNLSIDDVERGDFKAYDYSGSDMLTLTGGKSVLDSKKRKKRKAHYDPQSMPAHEFKPPSKPRLNTGTSKKSMSYSKGKAGHHQRNQWPKR